MRFDMDSRTHFISVLKTISDNIVLMLCCYVTVSGLPDVLRTDSACWIFTIMLNRPTYYLCMLNEPCNLFFFYICCLLSYLVCVCFVFLHTVGPCFSRLHSKHDAQKVIDMLLVPLECQPETEISFRATLFC